MKKSKRIIAAICAVAVLAAALTGAGLHAGTAQRIKISPDNTYDIHNGEFEGWGTSLCWWANRIGYSESLSQHAADLFYGEGGLRMNIARFNIGGGDDPAHDHIVRTDSNMPGYSVYRDGNITYDWTADANQRNVLRRAVQAAGDDMIVEMFCNSPPYYMTKSGCTGGSESGWTNNLKDDQYDDFARYIAEVCYHYEKEWGIRVQSVEAMNEPQLVCWKQNSQKQEGCHFTPGKPQAKMILELQKAMKDKGMEDVLLCGTDETSIDTQAFSFLMLNGQAKDAIERIDAHSYTGIIQPWLKHTAMAYHKNLWMSECDSGKTAGKDAGEMGAALWLAKKITSDMNGLNPSAWVLWQAIDYHVSKEGYNGKTDSTVLPDFSVGYWGIAAADHDNDTIVCSKKFYAFGQYSRYIRPGMTMLQAGGNTVAAFDSETGRIVLVTYNESSKEKEVIFDLSAFDKIGAQVRVIGTNSADNWKEAGSIPTNGKIVNATLSKQSVTTFIIDGCSR